MYANSLARRKPPARALACDLRAKELDRPVFYY